MNVSVILSTFNSVETIALQLQSLAHQTYSDSYEVIVADNGSTDESLTVARSFGSSIANLRVVDASAVRGVAHARNVGAGAATGRLLLFCDADDAVQEDWIERMAEALEQGDLIGGRLELDTLNDPTERSWRTDPDMTRLPRAMRFLPYAIGANFGVHAALFERLGGCDVRYVNGHDDVEFCWRVQLAGHTISFAENSVVHYRLRTSRRELARQRYRSGLTYAQLFAQYADLGITPGRIRTEFRRWILLIATAPKLLSRVHGGRWLFAAAWHWGRLIGSFTYKVKCPN
jgi:glycosyltransferase involved in cell wall biosynthesis